MDKFSNFLNGQNFQTFLNDKFSNFLNGQIFKLSRWTNFEIFPIGKFSNSNWSQGLGPTAVVDEVLHYFVTSLLFTGPHPVTDFQGGDCKSPPLVIGRVVRASVCPVENLKISAKNSNFCQKIQIFREKFKIYTKNSNFQGGD